MERHTRLAELRPRPERNRVGLDVKIKESSELLQNHFTKEHSIAVGQDLDADSFRAGIIPRLSPYDIPHIKELGDVSFVEVPEDLKERLALERSEDLIRWNLPERFLHRLKLGQKPFEAPVPGHSTAMDRMEAEKRVVSFDNLRIDSPVPKNGRHSRSALENTLEINLMGQARIPFALGSVPDVGSHLAYVTMAMAGGMVFMSRDKLLSDIDQQTQLAKEVIATLQKIPLPEDLKPNEEQLEEFREIKGLRAKSKKYLTEHYYDELRQSWINNVGAAIEAEPEKALKRAKSLYEAGCKLYRIYSPEGGTEIIETAKLLRQHFNGDNEVKIVGGQVMDYNTAAKAEEAGCDAIFIGVAGGSQCTTSVNADIPVKTPNLLYELRGTIGIPVGIEGGGVGTHINTAFALGASFVSKSGEIGVSWEGAGGKYLFQDQNENYWMLYGGEASVSAKWWKDSIDNVGRPKFVEGETGVRRIYHNEEDPSKRNISMTGNLVRLRNMLSIGLVFQRAGSIAEIHQRSCENIVEVTHEASALSQAYAK